MTCFFNLVFILSVSVFAFIFYCLSLWRINVRIISAKWIFLGVTWTWASCSDCNWEHARKIWNINVSTRENF